MSLLPPNSTTLERNVEKAAAYEANANALAGFKFREADSLPKLALIWEYSLAQVNVDDFQERIAKGLAFHRIRGTPASLKNALSWGGFEEIAIEEEPPGEHFAEFQIGLSEIPNSFDVEAIISAATLAAPLRSRLSRMYNSLYDVRRFALDGSKFGDFLSDDSGIRLRDGEPKLSFGRSNEYEAEISGISSRRTNARERVAYAKNADAYKLDFANLDDEPPDSVNRQSGAFPTRYFWNAIPIGNLPEQLLRGDKFAKALIVLSDSVLEDINSALSAGYEKLEEEPFVLSLNLLSQRKSVVKQVLIEERFLRENLLSAASSYTPLVSALESDRNRSAQIQVDSVSTKEARLRSVYATAERRSLETWRDHRHFNVVWTRQGDYTRITADCEAFYADGKIRSTWSDHRHFAAVWTRQAGYTRITEDCKAFYADARRLGSVWNDHRHFNAPWIKQSEYTEIT
ncbi:MAG: hypothetical protein LBM19_02085 [Holosporales bacterium]|jgi:P2-related tail formation protein|nr:hypothetical protein [Holosporales bacterium]